MWKKILSNLRSNIIPDVFFALFQDLKISSFLNLPCGLLFAWIGELKPKIWVPLPIIYSMCTTRDWMIYRETKIHIFFQSPPFSIKHKPIIFRIQMFGMNIIIMVSVVLATYLITQVNSISLKFKKIYIIVKVDFRKIEIRKYNGWM